MTVDEILIRASSSGEIMTMGDGMITDIQLAKLNELQLRDKNSRTGEEKPLTDNMRDELKKLIDKRDNPELSDTCKKRLIKIYAKAFHDREEDITSKYLEKGIEVEDDSISTYSRVKKKFFKKNEKNLTNKFVSGTPDFFDGSEVIETAEDVIDVKSSWSLLTFLEAKMSKKVNPKYQWQGDTYLGLIPSAKTFRLAYVLSNSPAKNILDEKRKLQFMLNTIDPEADPQYIELCKKIERNHIFDMELFKTHNPGFDFHNDLAEWRWDIPYTDRVHEFVITRDEVRISKLYKQIPICRQWIKDNLINKQN